MKKLILFLLLGVSSVIGTSQDDFNLFMSMIEEGYRPYLDRYQMFNGWVSESDTTSYVSSFIIQSGVNSTYIKHCIDKFSGTKSFVNLDGLVVNNGTSYQYSYHDINPDSSGIVIVMTSMNDRGYVKYSGRFRNRKDNRDGRYATVESIDSMLSSLPFNPDKQRTFDIYKLDDGEYYVMEIVDIINLLPPTINYRSSGDVLIIRENGLKPSDEICYGYPPSKVILVEVSEDIGRMLVNRFPDIIKIYEGKFIMSPPPLIPRLSNDIRNHVVVSRSTPNYQEDLIVMVRD